MNNKQKLNKFFSRFTIKNFTLYLVMGQVVVYFLLLLGKIDASQIILVGNRVLAGEVWRILTFMFVPMGTNFFIVFLWYIYYLFGSSLEQNWGSGRYTLYIFLGWIFHVLASLIVQGVVVNNYLIFLSVFVAYAHLFPNQEIYLFFFIPVKMKWLAIFYVGFYGVSFLSAIFSAQYMNLVVILFSFGNYLCFFTPELIRNFKRTKKRNTFYAKTEIAKTKAFHVCYYCKKDDINNKDLGFRYIEKDGDYICVCSECLEDLEQED